MAKIKHHNRQAKRSRKILQKALLELLQEKEYNKITITNITNIADLARPTFYAHYKTKDHLLASIIDEFLEKVFGNMEDPNVSISNVDQVIQKNIELFQMARESHEIVCLIKILDIDTLFLDRFRHYWNNFSQTKILIMKNTDMNYKEFLNEFLAFSIYAILKRWIELDMEVSDEVMGKLLFSLTGPSNLITSRFEYHKKLEEFRLTN